MRRTIFTMGFNGDASPWGRGVASGIPVYDGMSREQVEKSGRLKRLPVPPGVTVNYPYMVKATGEGEFWIKADGTTEFYSYKYGRWEAPKVTDKNDLWYQMTHLD